MSDVTPPPAPQSPEELDRRAAAPVIDTWYKVPGCSECVEMWPCTTVRLIATARRVASLEAVERAARAIEAHKEAGFGDEGPRWVRELATLELALAAALDAARTEGDEK